WRRLRAQPGQRDQRLGPARAPRAAYLGLSRGAPRGPTPPAGVPAWLRSGDSGTPSWSSALAGRSATGRGRGARRHRRAARDRKLVVAREAGKIAREAAWQAG